MSDKILLIGGDRLKPDDKSNHFAHKETAEMTAWTVTIKMDFEQCYILSCLPEYQ